METVKSDPTCDLIEEASPKLLLPPDSPDISDIFGDPQISPRVGNKYQVGIPPMVTGTEHLLLLMSPMDSECIPCHAHSFLLGLPLAIMWTRDEDIDLEDDGKGGSSKPDDGAKVDESVKSQKCRKGQSAKRKRNSELSAEEFDAKLVIKKESNVDNLECQMASKSNLFRPFEVKSSRLVPGSASDAWSNAEVDGFLLGLYVFGKDFERIKRFIENKDMGDILSFYYGVFYRSDGYRRWSDGQKRSRRKNKYGRKIFTGWRQQELLSRLLIHVPDELQNNLREVSKSFLEGKTSLESYVCHLKTSVGMSALVEAIGIGKGKADLTGLAMDPPRGTQVCHETPTGKDCSSLTSGEIISYLSGGSRLSKSRCNDIFWESVWPRLLARGWHSEQPKNRCSISSKRYLVFLMPGVKKFSRRKLVKGNHYFDSVSDVLSKVASEPTLIELDSEGNCLRSCNEGNGFFPGESSDQDDPAYDKPHYLKPRVSICSSNHMKFTVVDSSLIHGGKASKMRELRYSPIDSMFTSKPIRKDTQDSRKGNANHMPSKGDNCGTNARRSEGIIASSTAHRDKFTIVDTSSPYGGKSSLVRELRYEPRTADRLSSQGSVATDTKHRSEPFAADNFLKDDGKYESDVSNQNPKNVCIADQNLSVHQDEKSHTSEDARSKRIIKHFIRRTKSTYVSLVPPEKRKKFSDCVSEEANCLSENSAAVSVSLASPMEQQGLTACGDDLSKTATNVCGEEEQQAIVNPPRHSKRSRPLSTRVLESLESEFFNVKKTQKVRDVQARTIRFSSPCKAHSRVKAMPKHAKVDVKTVDTKDGKDPDGAFICSKDVMDQSPQVAR